MARMRPLTVVVSALALIGLGALGWVALRLSRRVRAPEPVLAEGPPASLDAGAGPDEVDAGPRRWSDRLTKLADRPPVPRLAEQVVSAAAESARKERELKELQEEARKDGFLFRESGSPKVYIVQNGTKFHIPNQTEFHNLGLVWEKIREVPPGSLGFLADRPPENSLFRERGDPRVYTFEGGRKRWIIDQGAMGRLGFQVTDVRMVPQGTLSSYPSGAAVR